MNRCRFSMVVIFLYLIFLFSSIAYANTLEKGIAEYRAERYEEALIIFQGLLNKEPNNTTALYYSGLISKQIGNYEEAIRYYLLAAEGTPSVKDAYIELIELYLNYDNLKEAKKWLSKAEKEGIKPAYVAFQKGLAFVKEGNNEEAIKSFTKAKELDKSLDQAATFQIAMVYMKEKKVEKVQESLKAIVAANPNTDLANFAKEYEDALSRNLKAYKTWHFSAGLGYVYDDNVIAAPSSSIPGTIISDQKDSSISASFSINYNPLIPTPYYFTAQYSIYGNTYFKLSEYNTISNNIVITPGINLDRSLVTLPVSYTYQLFNGKKYMGLFTIKPTYSIVLADRLMGQVSLGYGRRAMLQSPLFDDEKRDADIFNGSLGLYYFIKDNRGFLTARYEHAYEDAKGVNWKNNGDRLSLGILYPIVENLLLNIGGDVYLQKYKNVHSVFKVKRDDKIYSGSIMLTWEVIKDFQLNIQYAHTKSNSNIPVYDYKRNVYNLAIQYNF
jgi:tetratricopeptide (TPR) repeat protein